MSALRDKILNADDIEVELVEVPQWDATIQVRGMSGRERATMLEGIANGESVDFVAMYPNLVIACSYDPETGEKLFDASDLDLLLAKAGKPLETVAMAAMRVSGMDSKTVVDAGKDSSSPSEVSTSA